MTQLAIVVAVAIVALVIGWVMQRRAADPPTATAHRAPPQLDRADFARPDAPWLVAVFTSATCTSCAKVLQMLEPLESDDVAIQDVGIERHQRLHDRYGITAVPTAVVADARGVTRSSFLGPPTAAELWASVAELRSEGEASA